VLNALKQTGVDKNTLIIFFSDNGGAKNNLANNGILRDYKQSVYEGGIRVPFIVRWPAELPQAAVCSEPIISLDIMPTILSAASVALPQDRIYDGKDMLAVLRGKTKEPLHNALFWDDGSDQWAVRAGKWKLLSRKGALELYDLESDMREEHNLTAEHPDMVKKLQKLYTEWRSQMKEQISKTQKRKRKKRKL
jgi:arylsulfatase A-like enzyme